MSRIFIFDSQPPHTTKSDDAALIGNQFNLAQAPDIANAKRTNPVRCYTGQGEVRIVGVEFLLTQMVAGETYAFRWFPEFYCDQPNQDTPPNLRAWEGVDPAGAWMRPMVLTDGGSGNADLTPIIYRMTMQDRLTLSPPSESLYVPLTVHTLWMRLAVWIDFDNSTNVDQDTMAGRRLRIYACMGGHSEDEYLSQNGDRIYVYNAFK